MVSAIRHRTAPTRSRADDTSQTSYRDVLARPAFRLLVTSTALGAFGYSALTIFLPLYLVELEAPTWTAGALFSLNTAMCAVAGVPAAAAAAKLAPPPRIAQCGLIGMAGGFAVFAAGPIIGHAGTATLIVGLTAGMVIYTSGELLHAPMSTALALEQADPGVRGRYMAVNQMAWAVAGALAPALFTALLRWHLVAAPLLLVVLDLLAVATLTTMRRHPQPNVARPRTTPDPSQQPVVASGQSNAPGHSQSQSRAPSRMPSQVPSRLPRGGTPGQTAEQTAARTAEQAAEQVPTCATTPLPDSWKETS